MPTLPPRLGKRRSYSQKEQDERNIRQMERYYQEHEEVMSPERADTYRDPESPARKDYRTFQRLRSNHRRR